MAKKDIPDDKNSSNNKPLNTGVNRIEGQSNSPQFFRDFIGQESATNILKIFMEAASLRGESLGHILIYGKPGVGKTTLAKIIANEMNVNLRILSASIISRPSEMAAILNSLQEGDILLLNEIHCLKELYQAVPNNVLKTVLNYEISDDTLDDIFLELDDALKGEKLDLIIGGPPCQAYSVAGRARSETKMMGDKRNFLYKLYGKFLERYTPQYFVFENVTGLLSAKDEDGSLHFDNMIALFQGYGYSLEYKVLNAYDYGVLQNRKRVIIIGKLGKSDKDFYPKIPKYDMSGLTVSEIFKDLPELHAGEGSFYSVNAKPYSGTYLYDVKIKDTDKITFHIARPNTEQDLQIYKLVVKEWDKSHKRLLYTDLPEQLRTHKNMKSFLDRFKVVASNLSCSQTVVAHVAKDGHYYIHPDIKQNRSLTPREVARLQTFPDSYFFESKRGDPGRTAAFRQIGNAVPVRLAYSIAVALKDKIV